VSPFLPDYTSQNPLSNNTTSSKGLVVKQEQHNGNQRNQTVESKNLVGHPEKTRNFHFDLLSGQCPVTPEQ
jgi:hypothetical protein